MAPLHLWDVCDPCYHSHLPPSFPALEPVTSASSPRPFMLQALVLSHVHTEILIQFKVRIAITLATIATESHSCLDQKSPKIMPREQLWDGFCIHWGSDDQ